MRRGFKGVFGIGFKRFFLFNCFRFSFLGVLVIKVIVLVEVGVVFVVSYSFFLFSF